MKTQGGVKRTPLMTYPHGDPSPISILGGWGKKTKVYPYSKLDGYSLDGRMQEWDLVVLENEFIQVKVLPEVGGKVWGAIDKSTGKEFIYENDAVKFRKIGLRGPWSAGGIEFNFGIYGHSPTTAHPVDYKVRELPDGSKSCIVGALDLASRMEWRVEIILPKDKAYFMTRSIVYNPTSFHLSDYVWLTASAKTAEDLEVDFPGHTYLSHSGRARSWPVDSEGRDLSLYKNNAFGGSKTYHIMGQYENYLTGYWNKDGFGFGHWSEYADTPGQKIWYWSLARSGAIWGDLLSDEKGQYMEYQIGRYFSQPTVWSGLYTPFNLASMQPSRYDTWIDYWFPVRSKSVNKASPFGSLSIQKEKGGIQVEIDALQDLKTDLQLWSNEEPVESIPVELETNGKKKFVFNHFIGSGNFSIKSSGGEWEYHTDINKSKSARPTKRPRSLKISEGNEAYRRGIEYLNDRSFPRALKEFKKALELEEHHFDALVAMAELQLRRGLDQEAKGFAEKALQVKSYDPSANLIYALICRESGDYLNAKEALTWVTRDLGFRSYAWQQYAEIGILEGRLNRALESVNRSLGNSPRNIKSHQVKLILSRLLGEEKKAAEQTKSLLDLDPLNHLAYFEKYLRSKSIKDLRAFKDQIKTDLPHERFLEMAIYYQSLGLVDEACLLLEASPENPIVEYWLAWLKRSTGGKQKHLERASLLSIHTVFPFRRETLKVLNWVKSQDIDWKPKFYLAMILWSKDRLEEAYAELESCGEEATEFGFYLNRSKLHVKLKDEPLIEDIKRALALNPQGWRAYRELIRLYLKEKLFDEALALSEKAYRRFPKNYMIGMDRVKVLYKSGHHTEALKVLEPLRILPFEGSYEGKLLFDLAHISMAIEKVKKDQFNEALALIEKTKAYPERLGVGEPFEPDYRIQNYILAYIYKSRGELDKAKEIWESMFEYSKSSYQNRWIGMQYVGALAARYLGKEEEGLKHLLKVAKDSPENVPSKWAVLHFKNDDPEALKEVNRELDKISWFSRMRDMLSLIESLPKL